MNFEHAPLKKSFWRFILPSVIAQWIFALYTMVDGLFVARGVGETALAAVNIAMPFLNVLFSVSILFAVGTSTVVAIFLGQKKTEEANRAYTQNFVVLLVLCVFITALLYWKIEEFSYFLGASATTLPYVKDYILSILPFAWCFVLSYSFEILVKTDGYPRFATIAVISGALMNCVLDYVFVFIFHWGIWGAGFATGLSQFALIGVYLTHFLGKNSTMHFVKCHFDFKQMFRVIRIGLSSGVTELSAGVIVFLFNHMILKYIGENGIISYTIIAYVNTIMAMSMIGIAQGVQPLLSFFYGKKDYPVCRKLMRYTILLTACVSVGAFVATFLGADLIVSMFISDPLSELAIFSTHAMRIFAISFLFAGFNIVASGFFTSVEQPKASLAISVGRGFITITVALELCALVLGGAGIWWAATVSELLCLTLSAYLVYNYKKNSAVLSA